MSWSQSSDELTQSHTSIEFAKKQNAPLPSISHLTANLEAWLAELLVIFPVFGIHCIQESGKSVRALRDAELRKATHRLNESAHQSCIIVRGEKVGERHQALYTELQNGASFNLLPGL